MSKSKKKKKIPWKSVVLITVFLGVSFVLGWFGGSAQAPLLKELPKDDFLLGLIGIYVFLFLFTFLQTVIHEAGHLFFGLLTGYKYSSFRIGSFIWVKLDGKLRLKRYSLSGTGGQCLMAPPDMVDGKYPNVLYNFGGCIANFVFAVVFLAAFVLMNEPGLLRTFFGMLFAVGIGNVLLNGIPLQVGGISNDGRNALSLGKDETVMRAFWLQLYVNGLLSEGERMRDLPEGFFFLPEGEGLEDPIVCTVGVMRYNYYFDVHDSKRRKKPRNIC